MKYSYGNVNLVGAKALGLFGYVCKHPVLMTNVGFLGS